MGKTRRNYLFPKTITNTYSGSTVSLFAFIAITIVTIGRSFIHLVSADGGAQSIAGFPLWSYSIEARHLVILTFALWGISQLLVGIIYAVVLFRYRSLIPAMYLTIIIEYSLRLVVGMLKPALSTHIVPGGVVNYVMIPLGFVLLLYSLRPRLIPVSKKKR
ncbi:hypothetical protein HGA91_06230 [candidate division WWE3 bacterium]|nr:hypothetical protein [candidate division WWE3 bacterium]